MRTVTVELSEDQVVRLFEQLSPASQLAVLKRLILDFDRWEALFDNGAARMRRLCEERGLDWDRLTEEDRLQLVDTILHEA
jgi:hypothetical protein